MTNHKCGQSCIAVTFDQPLYAKAREKVLAAGPQSRLSGAVIRLGGFHLLLSFMGAIGSIMAGSGLEDLWETVYAKNSVVHMMSGRASELTSSRRVRWPPFYWNRRLYTTVSRKAW